jgi:nucleotide-binding universal stress UspA family protein
MTHESSGPPPQAVLICSAGTEATEQIIATAARLWPGHVATVLRVWQSSKNTIAASTAAITGTGLLDCAALDRVIERDAQADVAQSAEYARSLGLDALGDAVQAEGPVWQTILDEAQSYGAQAIVTGTRGRGDLEALILGSTSHALLHHSSLPIVVVPPLR